MSMSDRHANVSRRNSIWVGRADPGVFIMACLQEVDGGDRRDRTDDLKLAKLPLSQLSYVPGQVTVLSNQ